MNKTASKPSGSRNRSKCSSLMRSKGSKWSFVRLLPPCILSAEVIKGSGIQLGAQDVFWEDEGAYTGEISPGDAQGSGMPLRDRRALGAPGSTSTRPTRTCGAKWTAALAKGIGVIACVGETLKERQEGKTEEWSPREVRAIVDGLELADPAHLVIAYEPIWAIGTGETATSQEANRVAALIREEIAAALGADVAREIRIQYGGSVKPENIAPSCKRKRLTAPSSAGRAWTRRRLPRS